MATLPVRANASELFERYPDLTDAELEQLIVEFPRLPPVDVALMLSDEKLAPKLEAFRRDHHSKVRTPFRQYAVLIAIAFFGIGLIVWSVVTAAQ